TMATLTPANANSPANISPVGPPPTMTTACLIISSTGWSQRDAGTGPQLCEVRRCAHHPPHEPQRPLHEFQQRCSRGANVYSLSEQGQEVDSQRTCVKYFPTW